jgi:hypothetical protein
MFNSYLHEICEEISANSFKEIIENIKKPDNVTDDEWNVNKRHLTDQKIEIVGFTYEPKIKMGIPKEDPSLIHGGNLH